MLFQILLGAIVLMASVILGVAAIQVFLILSEVRSVLKKINLLLDKDNSVSLTSFFANVRNIVKDTENKIIDSMPDRVVKNPEPEKHPSMFLQTIPQQISN